MSSSSSSERTLFPKTIEVDTEVVAKTLLENWGLVLGNVIKASQNHTYAAEHPEAHEKYAVRVTPDPEQKHLQRITDELTFVVFLASEGLNHVCDPVPSSSGDLRINTGLFIISVYRWARGDPIDFLGFKWLSDATLISSW